MARAELELFARQLLEHVRDAAIRTCDGLLEPQASSPVARRWRQTGATAPDFEVIVPDVVDEALFALLRAIDEGTLRLKLVPGDGGHETDLTDEVHGELAGWFMGSGGWRAQYSRERYVDDYADLTE